jgi:hypothetical protein
MYRPHLYTYSIQKCIEIFNTSNRARVLFVLTLRAFAGVEQPIWSKQK